MGNRKAFSESEVVGLGVDSLYWAL